MNPSDELTLCEVEELTTLCLNGKSFTDADPIALAGAVMFMHKRRNDSTLEWQTFKQTAKMGDLKVFSELMNEETTNGENPTNGAMTLNA